MAGSARTTASRMDRVWLALPYVLFLAGAVPTWATGGLDPTRTVVSVAVGVALLGWHTGWAALRPERLAGRPLASGGYFLGMLAGCTVLFSLSFNFFPLYLALYPMAFVALAGGWAYAGVALTTAVALLGPGLLTLTPQNVIVTVAAATLAAVAGGSIRALETESERHRRTNAELSRIRTSLEAALADNLRLTDTLVAEAHRAGVAAERTRLAAEIHDTLAASLSGILAQLEALDTELPGEDGARRRVRTSIDVARDALREARQSVTTLRAGEPERTDLGTAIRGLAQRLGGNAGLPVTVEVAGSVVEVSPQTADAVLRATGEALTNIAKHAAAGHVYLTLTYLENQVAVDIADDGRGLAPADRDAPSGHGLAIMAERLAAVGGTAEVSGAPGRGTTVTLTAPTRPPGGGGDAG